MIPPWGRGGIEGGRGEVKKRRGEKSKGRGDDISLERRQGKGCSVICLKLSRKEQFRGQGRF